MTKGDAREWARRYGGRHPFLLQLLQARPSYRDLLAGSEDPDRHRGIS